MTDEAKLIERNQAIEYLREDACNSCIFNSFFDECTTVSVCYYRKAADLIESLSAELEQVKRERDAAVEDMKGICDVCAHFKTCDGPWCGDCDLFDGCGSPCKTCADEGNWQWRGVRNDE